MDNNELQHHGIKGMRWGVRRTDAQLARARGASPAKQTAKPAAKEEPAKKAATSSSGKSSAELTNAELRARIDRIKMERELAQLTAKQKSAGRKFVEDVLVNAGKRALTTFVADKLTDTLTKKFGGAPKDKDKKKDDESSSDSTDQDTTTGD